MPRVFQKVFGRYCNYKVIEAESGKYTANNNWGYIIRKPQIMIVRTAIGVDL